MHQPLRPVVGMLAVLLFASACSGDGDDQSAATTSTVTTSEASTTISTVTTSAASTITEPTTVAPTTEAPSCPEATSFEPSSERESEHDGLTRTYVLAVPSDYDATAPAPLLFDFHGFGGTAQSQVVTSDFNTAATDRGYIVVTPQGAPLTVVSDTAGGVDTAQIDGLNFWNIFGSGAVSLGNDLEDVGDVDAEEVGADDIAFIGALLAELSAELCIDEHRVYAAGMSNGAGMSTALACELGDRFAAVGPVAGVNLTGECTGTGPTSVLAIHGDADGAASYEGNFLLGFELGNPSVPDRMTQLAEVMACGEPTTSEPQPSVTEQTWTDCSDDVDVVLWTVADGQHMWTLVPDTTTVLLDFFDEHPAA